AAGIQATIEGGDQQVVPDAGSVWPTPGGDVTVDVIDQAEALGQIEPSHGGPEFGDHRLLGGRGASGWGVRPSSDDIIGAAEVLLPDDRGPAVDPAAFARVVVGLAVDGFFDNDPRNG